MLGSAGIRGDLEPGLVFKDLAGWLKAVAFTNSHCLKAVGAQRRGPNQPVQLEGLQARLALGTREDKIPKLNSKAQEEGPRKQAGREGAHLSIIGFSPLPIGVLTNG